MGLAAAVVGSVSRLVGAAADEVAHALRPSPGQLWSSSCWVHVRLSPPTAGVPASAIRRRRTAVADAGSARAGVSSGDLDPATGRLLVGHDPTLITRDEVLAAVAEAESSVLAANDGDRPAFGGRSI